MEKKVKEELDKLIIIGNESGMLRTSTVKQLLNDLNKKTEEDFEETMDIVRKVRYDSAFTFIYSKRTGTPAAKMENQIPEDVIKDRFDRLLKLVQDISAKKAGALTGSVQDVLVEELDEQQEGLVTGRLSNNSVVHLPGDVSMIGTIVPVLLKECKGFYYMGEVAE